MPKKAGVLGDAMRKVTAAPITAPAPEAVHDDHRPPSRHGRKSITVYLDAAAHRQLRLLALEQDSSAQQMVADAINDLFQKHGKPRIAN